MVSWAMARGIRSTTDKKSEICCWLHASDLYDDLSKYAEVPMVLSLMFKIAFGKSLEKRLW